MTAYHGENLGKNKYYFDHGETLPRYLNASPADHPRPHGLEDTRVVKGPVSLQTSTPLSWISSISRCKKGSGARVLEAQKYC